MKVGREALKQARSVFRLCFVNGQLDESRTREVLQALIKTKPRNAFQILHAFKTFVGLEVGKKTITIESATPVTDQGQTILKQLETQFGKALSTSYETNPELIGGLRIQVGSNVWDGSIRQRLQTLQTT
jgi:F-type H+-transporting ATPase subunit delta